MSVFCEDCGSPMEVIEETDSEVIYRCPVCNSEKNIKSTEASQGESAVQIKTKTNNPEFIDESKIKREGNKVDELCPECGNEGVWVVTMQTRAADEPPTRIYNCPECDHTWREYS